MPRKPNKTINIQVKSRQTKKGEELGIEISQEGTKKRFYKIKDNFSVDAAVMYYKDKYVKNKPKVKSKRAYETAFRQNQKIIAKKSVTITQRRVKRYINQLRRRHQLDDVLKSGIGVAIWKEDARLASQTSIIDAKKLMLSKHVLDPELLNIIVRDENVQKMKHRLEHRIQIRAEDTTLIAEITKFGITHEELQTELKRLIQQGQYISEDSPNMFWTNLKRANYNVLERGKGKVHRVTVTTIFRKS